MSQQKQQLSSRRLLARGVLIAGIVGLFVWFSHSWHGRAIEVELVHVVAEADTLLPAQVEVSVWENEVLHASATFYHPDSLAELSHTVMIPKGEYLITFSVVREFGETYLRFEQPLAVDEPGRYFLRYDLEGE